MKHLVLGWSILDSYIRDNTSSEQNITYMELCCFEDTKRNLVKFMCHQNIYTSLVSLNIGGCPM